MARAIGPLVVIETFAFLPAHHWWAHFVGVFWS